MKVPHGKLPVVAILIDTYTRYQRLHIDSISTELNRLGYGVLVVAGRELKPDVRNGQPTYNEANRIFSIAKSYNLSGFIILTGCIGHNMERSEIDTFVREFTHLPVVSLGVDIPSANSVSAMNDLAMQQLMEHVTVDPNRQKFVFIRGFKYDKDSVARERVFRDVLSRKEIHINENFFLTGNFIAHDAYTEMEKLLSRYNCIDVVVAANDDMAASAMRALRKRGYRIPEDVLVTGFDDSEIARNTSPQLTSVAQPIHEQNIATVEKIVSLMRNDQQSSSIASTRLVNRELKIRASSTIDSHVNSEPNHASLNDLDISIEEYVDEFIMRNSSNILLPSERSYEVLFHLVSLKLQTKADLYSHELSTLLDYDFKNTEQDLGWWRDFETVFTKFVLNVSRQQRFCSYIPSLLAIQSQLRELVWSLKNDLQSKHEYGALLQARLHAMLANCDDMDGIKQVLDIYFSTYEVKRAFLILYNSSSGSVDCVGRVGYQYLSDKSNRGTIAETNWDGFESKNILPTALQAELLTGTLVLTPLYHGKIQFGYLLIDPDDVNGLSYEYLTYSLSSALRLCSDMTTSYVREDFSSLNTC